MASIMSAARGCTVISRPLLVLGHRCWSIGSLILHGADRWWWIGQPVYTVCLWSTVTRNAGPAQVAHLVISR